MKNSKKLMAMALAFLMSLVAFCGKIEAAEQKQTRQEDDCKQEDAEHESDALE